MSEQPWYILPKINTKNKHAIVIGGGLAGTSVAYSLAARGWKVTLIERHNNLALEASGNPVGILTPLITHQNDPIGEFYLRGFEHSLSHLQILESSGQNIHFNNSGVIDLSTSKIAKDLSTGIIPSSDIIQVTSEQASNLSGVSLNSNGLYIEKGGWVNPSDLCQTNIQASGDNVEVTFVTNILSLVKSTNGWSAIDNTGYEVANAPVVVIANSADAKTFTQCNWVPLNPVRGQLTFILAMNVTLKKIICYDGGYITPEINGFNYIGATYSRDNMSPDVSVDDHKTNIENLKNVLDIGDVNYEALEGRVSFRASVPDRRPVIGAVPDINAFYNDYADLQHGRMNKKYPPGKYLNGLYISTGYGSRGLTSCPIAGELLANIINDESPILPEAIINLLSPARFIIKNLKSNTGLS